MSRRFITSNSAFETQVGYSRAVVSGSFIYVSGCTGYDYTAKKISPTIEAQTEQCFVNIASALKEAGASMKDVVRVRYILVDRKDMDKAAPVMKKWLGNVKPAATMMVAGLFEEEMKIEVEVTARKEGVEDEEGKAQDEPGQVPPGFEV